jgi:hypothetical protein
MNGVEIKISAIDDRADGTYIATMEIGGECFHAELERQTLDGGLVGFNFREETLFSVVLYCFGLDRKFNDDFERFVDGAYNLPWSYGEVEQEKLDEAFKKFSARTRKLDYDGGIKDCHGRIC